MRMPVTRAQLDDQAVSKEFTKLQDSINLTFDKIGLNFVKLVTVTCRPSEFPKLISVERGLPLGAQLVYVRNLTSDASYPATGVFLDWIPENNSVKIRAINGLTSTSLYELRFIIYG